MFDWPKEISPINGMTIHLDCTYPSVETIMVSTIGSGSSRADYKFSFSQSQVEVGDLILYLDEKTDTLGGKIFKYSSHEWFDDEFLSIHDNCQALAKHVYDFMRSKLKVDRGIFEFPALEIPIVFIAPTDFPSSSRIEK